MTLNQKTTHVSDALGRLISIFKDQTNIEALLMAFVSQTQKDENTLFELLLERTIDTAIGEQLDGIGELVNAERSGRTDDEYRVRLRAQVLINISSGTGDQLNSIMELMTGNTFTLQELFPAGFKFVIDDELAESPTEIASAISDARGGGIDASIEYTLTTDALTFTFATADSPEASVDQGWSNDGGTSGGKFADCEEA